MAAQTWNSLLNFIKRNTGAKLNFLEMTDEEIIEGIKEDVLPFFSQYTPHKKFVFITNSNRVTYGDGSGENQWVYRIPKEISTERIIDIFDAFSSESDVFIDEFGQYMASSSDLIDLAIANYYTDMAKYLEVRNTWEFLPPEHISFDQEISNAVVIYNTDHATLETVRSDYYETIFKQLCLGYVQKWIAALRSKYETIATPFGEIRVNWQKLEEDSSRNIDEAKQRLELIPLDHFIHVSV